MKSKKKVLVFIDWYIPGYKAGGPVQSCANLVGHLSDTLEFYIVTRDTDYTDTEPYQGIKANQWNKIQSGVSVMYLSRANLKAITIRDIIEKTPFDFVYLNGMFSFWFTLLPIAFLKGKRKKKIIIAVRGMLAPGALAIKGIKKKLFFFFSKRFGYYRHVVFQASSPEESVQIKKQFPENRIVVAPNLGGKYVPLTKRKTKEVGSLHLINIARISPEKNLLFALEILKSVKGNVHFTFYGPVNDESYYKRCKTAISQLPDNITVVDGGALRPDLISQKISESHFLFMPTLGENFGHIIFQSLSSGLPVLISDKTIWKDLHAAKSGWDTPLNDLKQWIAVLETCVAMNQNDYQILTSKAPLTANAIAGLREAIQKNRELFT